MNSVFILISKDAPPAECIRGVYRTKEEAQARLLQIVFEEGIDKQDGEEVYFEEYAINEIQEGITIDNSK